MEGALSAISGNQDFLGLMVLACATAFGGDIIRDLLIGDIPPPSLRIGDTWPWPQGGAFSFCTGYWRGFRSGR